MIESSMMINDKMPEYCVDRAAKLLNRRAKKAMNGSKVLVLGVAYKQDIDDYRESPALRVIEELEKEGAVVTYFDPWVKEYKYKGQVRQSIPALTEQVLKDADLVMVTTAHHQRRLRHGAEERGADLRQQKRDEEYPEPRQHRGSVRRRFRLMPAPRAGMGLWPVKTKRGRRSTR